MIALRLKLELEFASVIDDASNISSMPCRAIRSRQKAFGTALAIYFIVTAQCRKGDMASKATLGETREDAISY
jgi:hypothetical protein